MSVYIVDNELTSSIKELGNIVDEVKGDTSFSQALQSHITDDTTELKDRDELISKIYTSSEPSIIGKLTDKEFEPTFNLIIYILSELEGGFEKVFTSNSRLLTNLLAVAPKQQLSLRDRKSIKGSSVLSELNLIFNLLPATSPARIVIIETILKYAKELNFDYAVIEHAIGQNLVAWLKQANATEQQIKQIFWGLIDLDQKFTLPSLKLIKSFTNEYSLNLNELQKLIAFALSSDVIDLSFLVNQNISQAIASNPSNEYVQLFNQYVNRELISSVAVAGLPNELIYPKSQILSLCQFFENSNKLSFSYAEIPFDNDTELEIVLINSIKYGLLEGELNQVDRIFKLIKVNKLILSNNTQLVEKNLEDVKQNLQNWRNSLVNINEVVNSFRENIVNNTN